MNVKGLAALLGDWLHDGSQKRIRFVQRRIRIPHRLLSWYSRLPQFMERIMNQKLFVPAGIAALVLAAPAVAHHSYAMFRPVEGDSGIGHGQAI